MNADTKEGEGAFYTWRAGELQKVLPNTYDLIAGYYNVSEKGNWVESRNVLFASFTPLQYARIRRIEPSDFSSQLAAAKSALAKERNKRERPTVDDKILTSWNALLIKGFIDAYAALGDETYLQYALSCARFIENKMLEKNGNLWRNFKDGKRTVNAFLDDYTFLAKAYIRLYQLTFDKHWLILSQQLIEYSIKNFFDPDSGMFFYTANLSDGTLLRKIEITDNAIPSSNSIMAEILYTLGVCFDNEDYLNKSKRMLSRMYKQLREGEENYYTSWCFLTGLFSHGTNEVAIMGKDALIKNRELQKNYLPASIFIGSKMEENLPLLEGKSNTNQTLIYVCTNGTCKRPVEEVNLALKQINGGLQN
ncbi:MAG: thioredoxin domain-containing protein [Chitinophagaceae bacterium]|nr:thioredoxin domain-containing protein [Chitinophagaceae bacterium]